MKRLFLAFYLPLIVAYADTFWWIWQRWDGEYYSHGPILPFIAVAVLYARRARFLQIEAAPDLRGWWLLGSGLFLRFCGAAQEVDSLSAFSLLFSLTGVVWLTVGTARLRVALPVLLLLLFATPLPMDFTGRLAFELKEVAIQGAVTIGNAFGLGAIREGASLRIPGQAIVLPVADACGGLRSLLAMTALGYCLAFFIGSARISRRVVLLLLTIPAAVMVNVLRIMGLCYMAKHVDVYYAGGSGHTIMNLVAWLANIAILLGADALMERRHRAQEAVGAPAGGLAA